MNSNGINGISPAAGRLRFSDALATDAYRKLIERTLGDPERAKRFVASITAAVAANPKLQECDAKTVLAGALQGEALGLSPSPQLGHFYLVPFKGRAQFVIGYRGFIQLALRSSQLRRLNVLAIKRGELLRWCPFTEEIELELIEDELLRETTETAGYCAYLELASGFRKTVYWNKEKVAAHARQRSPSYHSADGRWQKDFDAMAEKTLLRELLGKWGMMSAEMQAGYANDEAVVTVGSGGELAADCPAEPENGQGQAVPAAPAQTGSAAPGLGDI